VPIEIIIDAQEQCPWGWEEHQATTRIHSLATADYALAQDCYDLEGREKYGVRFAIERKSLDDFLGTISSGWDRFQREIERMAMFPALVVIVEGTFEQCCFREGKAGEVVCPTHNHPRLSPRFVARRVSELAMMRVCVVFAGNAAYAAALAYQIFCRRAESCAITCGAE
jgi:hypothetical protein